MQSVSSTTGRLAFVVSFISFFAISSSAQVNSPFSRYGLGNLVGSQHAISRSMGGLSAAYADGANYNVGQAVNFNNPATYGSNYMVTYDLGLSIDSRKLKSNNPNGSFSSIYVIPSYLAVSVPLNKLKGLGLAFGLRPITRLNYGVESRARLAGDSIGTIYEGTGGTNQAFIGVGKKWKKLSIGANTGYTFGRQEISTSKTFYNDTLLYFQSRSASQINFGSMFLQAGIQYEFTLSKKENAADKSSKNLLMRIGATASFQQNMNAVKRLSNQTYVLNAAGGLIEVDSIAKQDNIKGTIVMPATYDAGFMIMRTLTNSRGNFQLWSAGLEFTTTQWTKYRYYGQPDALNNSWALKMGAQISPNPDGGTSYLSNVNYRLGFQFGKDYINADGNGLKHSSFTLGAGFPIRKWRNYETQFTVVQAAMQFGKRGSAVNNITENYTQITLGFSLSDMWFIKRRYD
ncbi:MAG: hypothetical protein Q7U77_07445 [Sediminibacterium sp.]|uniref:hypothetical protein n=1 Tax=Sediminibacterium sp. TaxID=1917865 RepID=UPI002728F2FB|nr:hypothetical protein [Sediminibacterium sp.]MDO8996446.1 hypothetical protein [Sediminibacterium sp.]